MLGMKNNFDIRGGIEIREVDIAGVACTVNKSIKETENFIFVNVRSNFISLMNTKTCISLGASATRENTAFGVHSVKQNSILHWTKQISSIYPATVSCAVGKGAPRLNYIYLLWSQKMNTGFIDNTKSSYKQVDIVLYYMDWLIQVVYKVKYHGLWPADHWKCRKI